MAAWQGVCKVDLSGLGSFGREGGWQVAQVVDRLARWWTVSIPAAVPFGRRQRHIRFASFRPEQRPSRLRVLARPYPPTISIEIAEVVHRHRRVGMRHADGPQVPLKSKVRFQWNLRLLSAEADSMNVFAPGVTRPRKDSTVRVGRSSTTRIREAKNTRARLLDRPSRLEQPPPGPAATHTGFPAHRLQRPPETVHTTPQGLDCGGGPVKHNPNQGSQEHKSAAPGQTVTAWTTR